MPLAFTKTIFHKPPQALCDEHIAWLLESLVQLVRKQSRAAALRRKNHLSKAADDGAVPMACRQVGSGTRDSP